MSDHLVISQNFRHTRAYLNTINRSFCFLDDALHLKNTLSNENSELARSIGRPLERKSEGHGFLTTTFTYISYKSPNSASNSLIDFKKKEWRGPKLIKHFTRSEVDERYKVTSGGARTCLVPNNPVQACVVVTSRVESTVLHYPCNVYPRVVASNPAWDCIEISKPKNHAVRLNTIINHKYVLRSSLLL